MMASPDPMAMFRVNEFLGRQGILPNITSLDLSGDGEKLLEARRATTDIFTFCGSLRFMQAGKTWAPTCSRSSWSPTCP